MSSRKTPFLTDEKISFLAAQMLHQFSDAKGEIIKPPIPVEDIAEMGQQLALEVVNLRHLYGFQDVLGAIDMVKKVIRIDQSLDPGLAPGKLGRYRFTLAHELGHWALHQRQASAQRQPGLTDDTAGQSILCRAGENTFRIELQADHFAAALLMPREMVVLELKGLCGVGPFGALPHWGYSTATVAPATTTGKDWTATMADLFQVSRQAMRIRLEELGLLSARPCPEGVLLAEA